MFSLEGSFWHRNNDGFAVGGAVYIFLFICCIILSKLKNTRPKINGYIPECGMIFVIGIMAGRLIYLVSGGRDDQLAFSPTVFLYILIPPILFNQAYNSVNQTMFSRYITPIAVYGVVGTLMGSLSLAGIIYLITSTTNMFYNMNPGFMEILAFSSLLSTTNHNPILSTLSKRKADPHLFHLLNGELVINNLVAIILFEASAKLNEASINHYLSACDQVIQYSYDIIIAGVLGPAILASLWNFGVLYLLRRIPLKEQSQRWELAIYLPLTLYAPFLLSECICLNGFSTIILSGLLLRRYDIMNNLTEKKVVSLIVRRLAQYSETLAYLEMGITVFTYWRSFKFGFIVLSLIGILIGRMMTVVPTTFLYNLAMEDDEHCCYLSESKITNTTDVNQSFPKNDTLIAGKTSRMMRYANIKGVIAYGLVRILPNNKFDDHYGIYVITTILLIAITTFTFGMETTTNYVLSFLNIQMEVDEALYMEYLRKKLNEDPGDPHKDTNQETGIDTGNTLHGRWRLFEQKYIIKALHEATIRGSNDDNNNSTQNNQNDEMTVLSNGTIYYQAPDNKKQTNDVVNTFYRNHSTFGTNDGDEFSRDHHSTNLMIGNSPSALYDYGQ